MVFPTLWAMIQIRIGPSKSKAGLDAHVVLPSKKARQFLGMPPNLVMQQDLNVIVTPSSILAHHLVCILQRGTQQGSVVEEGKPQSRVVWGYRFVFLRPQKILKLLRVKLRSKGCSLNCLNKPNCVVQFGKVSNWKSFPEWQVFLGAVLGLGLVKIQGRGRGWDTRRRVRRRRPKGWQQARHRMRGGSPK